jgi:hypothetical protein
MSEFYLKPLGAGEAAKAASLLLAKLEQPGAVEITLTTNTPGLELRSGSVPKDDGLRAIREFATRLDGNDLIDCMSFTLALPRATPGNKPPRLVYDRKDGVVATLALHDTETLVLKPEEFVQALDECFNISTKSLVLSASLPPELREMARAQAVSHEHLAVSTERLQKALADLVGGHAAHVRKVTEEQDARFKSREEQLEAKIERREEQLEAKTSAREAEAEKARKEFEEKLAGLDLRDSRAVRRDLLTRIENQIASVEKVKLSDETCKKRQGVSRLFILALLATAAMAGFSLWRLLDATKPGLEHAIPFSVGVVSFLSTMIFFIRWTDQWFKEHARVEFWNIKLSSDILRASWLAELIFEWEAKEEREFPEALSATFSRNLFQETKLGQAEHPGEQLLSLLGRAASVKVSKDNVQVRLRRGAKKYKPS